MGFPHQLMLLAIAGLISLVARVWCIQYKALCVAEKYWHGVVESIQQHGEPPIPAWFELNATSPVPVEGREPDPFQDYGEAEVEILLNEQPWRAP